MKKYGKLTPAYFAKNFSIVVGLVLIWRGIWYVLDAMDSRFFGGSHLWTALGGIILGLIVLYVPENPEFNIEVHRQSIISNVSGIWHTRKNITLRR